MKICIGGMIASGKTTLLRELSNLMPAYENIGEFRKGDEVFNSLLKWVYEGKEEAGLLLQIYFINKHWQSQKEHANDENILIDRHLFEHWLFAKERLKNPVELNMYNNIFHTYMNDIPEIDLYLILDVNWETFKERMIGRGRPAEVENFARNEDYFHRLLDGYTEKIAAQCVIYDIPYKIIYTSDKTEMEVLEEAERILLLNADY